MSKQLVAPKHQADLVESLMGVLCQAQIEHAEKPAGTKLARGLNAALAFFEAFVLPDKEAAAAAAREPRSAAEMLCESMLPVSEDRQRSWLARPRGREWLEERKGDIEAAFKIHPITARADLLQECCAWNNDAVFQRLEFLGDAFLQCALPPLAGAFTPDQWATASLCGVDTRTHPAERNPLSERNHAHTLSAIHFLSGSHAHTLSAKPLLAPA